MFWEIYGSRSSREERSRRFNRDFARTRSTIKMTWNFVEQKLRGVYQRGTFTILVNLIRIGWVIVILLFPFDRVGCRVSFRVISVNHLCTVVLSLLRNDDATYSCSVFQTIVFEGRQRRRALSCTLLRTYISPIISRLATAYLHCVLWDTVWKAPVFSLEMM